MVEMIVAAPDGVTRSQYAESERLAPGVILNASASLLSTPIDHESPPVIVHVVNGSPASVPAVFTRWLACELAALVVLDTIPATVPPEAPYSTARPVALIFTRSVSVVMPVEKVRSAWKGEPSTVDRISARRELLDRN